MFILHIHSNYINTCGFRVTNKKRANHLLVRPFESYKRVSIILL